MTTVRAALRAGEPTALIGTRPEPIELPLARSAVIVVDLQNGYASPGGYRDLYGRDMSESAKVVANSVRVIDAARAAGMTIVFLQNGWDLEQKTTGGPDSPNWHKSNPLKLMRTRAELAGKILTHGSWDYALVPALAPQSADLIVEKARYGGFTGTALDALLRARDIRHLVFVGIATNVCVESTLREAFHREYFCVLVEDATHASGPPPIQAAVVYSVETFLGWVTSTESFCGALRAARSTP